MIKVILWVLLSILEAVVLGLVANYYIEIRDVKEDYLVKEVVLSRKISYKRFEYAKDLEAICDTYKSSKEKKEIYHKSMPNYANLFE